MAQSLGKMVLKLVADPSGLVGGLASATNALRRFTTGLGVGIAKEIASIPGRVMGVLKTIALTGFVIRGLEGIGDMLTKPIQFAADLEMAAISFKALTGSAEKGKQVLGELQGLALKNPFFSTDDILNVGLQLAATGIEADKLVKTVAVLGEVSAASRGDLTLVARAFAQVQARGHLMAQETHQFENQQINLMMLLGDHLGKTRAELTKMQEEGQISFDDVAQALEKATQAGGRFFGLADQAGQTVTGKWRQLTDQLKLGLTQIGLTLVDGLDIKGLLEKLNEFASWFRENFPRLRDEAIDWAEGFALAVIQMAEDFLEAIASIADSLAGLDEFFARVEATNEVFIGGIQEVGSWFLWFEETVNGTVFVQILNGLQDVREEFVAWHMQIADITGSMLDLGEGSADTLWGFAVPGLEDATYAAGRFDEALLGPLRTLKEIALAMDRIANLSGLLGWLASPPNDPETAEIVGTQVGGPRFGDRLRGGLGGLRQFLDEMFGGLRQRLADAKLGINPLDPNLGVRLGGGGPPPPAKLGETKLAGAAERGSREAASIVAKSQASALGQRAELARLASIAERQEKLLAAIRRAVEEGQSPVLVF